MSNASHPGKAPHARELIDEGLKLGISVEDLLSGILRPSLYTIGNLWQEGKLCVATEHEYSALTEEVIEALFGQFEGLFSYRQNEHPHVLLVCADGNYHTLGVRMLELLLMLRRIPSYTLIPGLPLTEILELAKRLRPKVVGISVSMPEQLEIVAPMQTALSEMEFRPELAIGGFCARKDLSADSFPGIQLYSDAGSFVRTLAAGVK